MRGRLDKLGVSLLEKVLTIYLITTQYQLVLCLEDSTDLEYEPEMVLDGALTLM